MQYKKFGTTDLEVSAMGLGCSRLGGSFGGSGDKEAIATLQQAFDSGINFYDTADSYGQGKSETLLGKTFKNQRDQVIFSTKAGYCLSAAGSLAAKVKPLVKPLIGVIKSVLKSQNSSLDQARGSFLQQDFSADYLKQSVEGSLKRLGTDYIDLFQLHSPPSTELQSGEVFLTLDSLQQQGKIRYYGVSCDTIEDALLCLQYPNVSSIQVEINLLEQRALQQLLPNAQTKGKAIIARQPFASGKLLKLDDDGTADDHLKVSQYLQLSTNAARPITQFALQFLLQLEEISVVIPGASRPTHLQDNLAALSAPPLTAEELAAIAAISIP
jgi:aryl-alcohol dehydrogenase-like predicted oxidoreductase